MKLFLFALMIAVLSFAPVAQAATNTVGKVLEVEGEAKITDTAGQTYDAQVGTEVHPQDILTTGAGAKLYIQFIDNTEFTLSENAQFTVEEYNFNEKDASQNYATYSVLEGAFLYVSGLVAKKQNPDVKVNIPQGSIGIRGTKFWGGMVDGKYGVIVGEGKVTVRNKAGSATLIKGQGTTLVDRTTKPEAPKKWAPEKIARATATVTLKDPGAVGTRMIEARKEQAVLRAEHVQAQADVKRIDPVVLEERVEQKILLIRPEMRPDLLEEKAKAEAAAKAEADAKAAADAQAKEDGSSTLRERLEQERLNSVDQNSLLNRLNNTDAKVETTVTETVKPLETLRSTTTTTVKAPDPGTTLSTTTTRETLDKATDTGTRVLNTTTETTNTVTNRLNDSLKTTTETVKESTEILPYKENTVTEPLKETEPASQPVEKDSRLPVTDAVKQTLSTTGKTVESVTSTVRETTTSSTNTLKNTLGGVKSGTREVTTAKPLDLKKD